MTVEAVGTDVPRWVVKVTAGEGIRAHRGEAHGLEFVLLGLPAQVTSAAVGARLEHLAAVAEKNSRAETQPRAIPALLHEAVIGLLAESEMWADGSTATATCAVVLLDSAAGCAMGWVGESGVQVLVDGKPCDIPWFTVSAASEQPGKAASFPDRSHVRATITWPAGQGAGATIEAERTPRREPKRGLAVEIARATYVRSLSAVAGDSDSRWPLVNKHYAFALYHSGPYPATNVLEEAAKACRTALRAWTPKSDPLEWADTQHLLGVVLGTLGARESRADLLKEAITAFQETFRGWILDSNPYAWSGAVDNLTWAIRALGALPKPSLLLPSQIPDPRLAAFRFKLKAEFDRGGYKDYQACLRAMIARREWAFDALPRGYFEIQVVTQCYGVIAAEVSTLGDDIKEVRFRYDPLGSEEESSKAVHEFLLNELGREVDYRHIVVANESETTLITWSAIGTRKLEVEPKQQTETAPGAEPASTQSAELQLGEGSFDSALTKIRDESAEALARFQTSVEPLVNSYLAAVAGRTIASVAERKEFVAQHVEFLNRTLHRVACADHGKPSALGVGARGKFLYRHAEGQGTCPTRETDGARVPLMRPVPWRPPRR
jgi:hypothetical protein